LLGIHFRGVFDLFIYQLFDQSDRPNRSERLNES
jgi:hypothetical protein